MSRGKNTEKIMRRGQNKPLAWYIGEKLMEKGDTDRETPSPSSRANSVNRKSSIESQASLRQQQTILPSSFPSDLIEEKKKRSAKKNPKQRTKRISANFSFPSNESKDQTVFVRELNNSSSDKSFNKEKKEDYWYYDPVSDGFYYEHNGSRGWRRRNPKIHAIPVSVKVDENEQKLLLSTAIANTTNIQQQQQQSANKFVVNQGVNPMSNMKYDPNTDGYFYEMASVDGWKKRQPATGTTPPTMSSSLRDSIQRPQMPTHLPPNFSLLPSFLQSSLLHSGPTQRIVVPSMPIQDSNSTTPQALSHVELEEMVMRDNGYCGSLMETSNNGGNLPSAEPLLNRSRINALSDESSTASSISDDLTTTPPPPVSRHSSFLRTIHQRQIEHSKAMPIQQMKNSEQQHEMTPQNTSLPVGSFVDEPYEFYWCEDKAPSVCSMDDNASAVSQDLCTELLSYFTELRIQPQRIEAMPFDTFRQRTGSSSMKRPTTLNIQNNNDSWKHGQNPEKENSNFNVDKFIQDLPSLANENILNNLYAMKTPMGEQLPSINDSPIFTPIHPWKIPVVASSKDNHIPPRELTSADIGGNSFLYKDLERIWQFPAA